MTLGRGGAAMPARRPHRKDVPEFLTMRDRPLIEIAPHRETVCLPP
jgi:hypothetical protein